MRCHAETSPHSGPNHATSFDVSRSFPKLGPKSLVVTATRDRPDLGLMDNPLDTSRRSRLPPRAFYERLPCSVETSVSPSSSGGGGSRLAARLSNRSPYAALNASA